MMNEASRLQAMGQTQPVNTGRRQFLKTTVIAGSGFSLALVLPSLAAKPVDASNARGDWRANAWLEITADNQVIFTLDRVEMGQGTQTGLTTLLAEELDVDPQVIKVKAAAVAKVYRNPDYGLQMTGGSNSIASSWQQIRLAGATAKAMLLSAAAAQFAVALDQCRAELGTIKNLSNGERLTYGQLAKFAATQSIPSNVQLKPTEQFKYIGKHNKRLDISPKVDGSSHYGIDQVVAGMVYAVVSRSPVFGGKLHSVDPIIRDKVQKMPGVIDVFIIDRGVAIVAQQYWQARKAQRALKISWDEGEHAQLNSSQISEFYQSAAAGDPGEIVRQEGDFAKAQTQAQTVIKAQFQAPFMAHATMEPMNCTAWVQQNKADIWLGSQAPDTARIAAARVTDLAPDQIEIHNLMLGGGFGRRLTHDFVEEAAAISAHIQRPVKLLWSREEDTQHDWYRPASLHHLSATINQAGELAGWHHQVTAPEILPWFARNAAPAQYPFVPKMMYDMMGKIGLMAEGIAVPKDVSAYEGAAELPYAIEHIEVRHTLADAGIPISYWRSVGHSHNGFVVESFMDEVAHQLGKDPYQFRYQLLAEHPRWQGVLKLAAEQAHWGQTLAEGHFHGIAAHKSFKTYVAEIVELSVVKQQIKLHKVTCAVDCGTVVNPDIVVAQMESGIIFGLSAALYGEITLEKGRVLQSNFDDYPMMRMQDAPQIQVHVVNSQAAPTGVGEPGVPPIAAAVANAVFAATGQRLRQLPLRLT